MNVLQYQGRVCLKTFIGKFKSVNELFGSKDIHFFGLTLTL
jgi:hypothetical protein